MTSPVVAMFSLTLLLEGLIWAAMALLNFWIWQKSKASSNLLMLIGAGLMGLPMLLGTFGIGLLDLMWLPLLGSAAFLVGFYLSVKPMVEAQIAALQAKMKHAAQQVGHKDAGGSGGATPPAPPPPAAK